MPLTRRLLDKLNDALVDRRVGEGFALLRRSDKDLSRLSPTDSESVAFLLCVAQWVDLGYRDFAYLDGLIARFADVPRSEMRFGDYLRLRMVEAHRAFVFEDAPKAASIFGFVLQVEPGIVEPPLMVLAHYWKCRAHRTQGEYELALHHIQEAKKLAQQMGAPRLVAVTNIHESWLLFQRGQRREALRLLDEAEAELKATGHALSLGNIESARGRLSAGRANIPRPLNTSNERLKSTGNTFRSIPTWPAPWSTRPT